MLRTESNQNPNQPRYNRQGHVLPPAGAALLGNEWVSGLCSCLDDCGSAIDICVCHWCQMGYQYHRLRKWYVDMDAAVCCGAWCLDLFTLMGGSIIMTMYLRSRIAERYGIKEHICGTICYATFCNLCALCQQHREMSARGEYSGGVCISKPCCEQPPPPMMTMYPGMQHTHSGGLPPPAPGHTQRNHSNNSNIPMTPLTPLPAGAVYAVPCNNYDGPMQNSSRQNSSSDYSLPPPTPMAPMMPPTPLQPPTPRTPQTSGSVPVVSGQVLPLAPGGYQRPDPAAACAGPAAAEERRLPEYAEPGYGAPAGNMDDKQ